MLANIHFQNERRATLTGLGSEEEILTLFTKLLFQWLSCHVVRICLIIMTLVSVELSSFSLFLYAKFLFVIVPRVCGDSVSFLITVGEV